MPQPSRRSEGPGKGAAEAEASGSLSVLSRQIVTLLHWEWKWSRELFQADARRVFSEEQAKQARFRAGGLRAQTQPALYYWLSPRLEVAAQPACACRLVWAHHFLATRGEGPRLQPVSPPVSSQPQGYQL